MKILVIGYSESGKSTAAELLAKLLHTTSCNLSDYIIEDYAKENNLDTQTIKNSKAALRKQLYEFGRSKQAIDSRYPATAAIKHHDIITGTRNPDELLATRNLFDVVIWIDRATVTKNSTDKLLPEHADVRVDNNGSLKELESRLKLLLLSLQMDENV